MANTFSTDLNLTANLQPKIYVASCIVYFLAILAVALRFYARKLVRASFWWDDWLIIVSLILESALFVDIMLLLHFGLGRHVESVVPTFSQFMKTYLAGDVIYTATLAFSKYSILALYWRIFGQASKVRLPIYILAALVSGWFLEVISLPLASYGTALTKSIGSCVNLRMPSRQLCMGCDCTGGKVHQSICILCCHPNHQFCYRHCGNYSSSPIRGASTATAVIQNSSMRDFSSRWLVSCAALTVAEGSKAY